MHIDRNTAAYNYGRRRLSSDLREVDARLGEWGQWARHDGSPDWPPITVLGRVIEEGFQGASQPTKPPTVIPERIAEVDAAVAKLKGIYRMVIRVRYVTCPHLPVEQQRARVRMSASRWKRKLEVARELVAHALAK